MSKTHLIGFVLDETGSMQLRKKPTISGFNEWMAEMEKFPGDLQFTMLLFNTEKHELLHKQAVLSPDNPVRLTNENYLPSGGTPLFDAIGKMIREIEGIQSSFEDETSVTFVILTDGEENSSREYSLEAIQSLIQEKETAGWTFTYLGATPESWESGFMLGISPGNIMNYSGDPHGTRQAFAAHGSAMTSNLNEGGGQTFDYYADYTDPDTSQLIIDDEEEEEDVED